MESVPQFAPISSKRLWTGRIISALVALFLLFDAVAKLFKPVWVVEPTVQLGYPETKIVTIGLVLLVCTVIYLIPRTTFLGAILLTGYLGGAVATHVRAGNQWFPIFFPVIMGILIWGGYYLREGRLKALIPLRS